MRRDDGVTQEARFRERLHEPPARPVDIMMVDEARHDIGREGRNLRGEAAMTLLEEGQAQESLIASGIAHQLPSKTGFSFLAKARKARRKSSVCMHSACATASASMAASIDIAHSMSSMRLVMALPKFGPSASVFASAFASPSTASG